MKKNRKKSGWREQVTAWCFLLPYMIFFIGFLMFPILRGMKLSLYNSTLGGKEVFIGLQNYVDMFQDPGFWEAIWNTVFYVLISTPVMVVVGFIFALFINSKIKGITFIRTCLFSPYVLSMSVVTGLWIFIFQPYTGLVTRLTSHLGIEEMYWLNTKGLVWVAILITTVWWTVGFNMILFLAGLQDVPEEVYEAAQIDGAGRFQTLLGITVPMMKDSIALVVMLQMIASFKLFGQTYLMSGGGPGTSTRTIVHYIYETGFTNRHMGSAAAMSVAFFVVVLLASLIQNKLFAGKEG